MVVAAIVVAHGVALSVGTATAAGVGAAPAVDVAPAKAISLTTVHIIAHSHNDPGWLESESQYFQQRTKKIITNVVQSAFLHGPVCDESTLLIKLPGLFICTGKLYK